MGREPARKHFTSGGRAGHANFDLAKETLHVVSRTIPEGENFRLLVTTLGCKLTCPASLAPQRLKYWFCTKPSCCHGSRTAAIDHATDTVLAPLDRVQGQFLQCVGLSAVEALTKFKLAPQATRRDIAMLGLVRRMVFGHGPPYIAKFFGR